MTGSSRLNRGVSLIATLLAVLYPFLIYAGWERINPRLLIGSAILLAALRLWLTGVRVDRSRWINAAAPWILPVLFLILAFAIGHRSLFLYWPVAVSFALLVTFGRTLIYPPSLVERFARLQKSDLTPEEIIYCHRVTLLWCAFFIVNGTVAGLLASTSSLKNWTLYNGLISYFIVGGLLASEYAYRHWRFRPQGAVLSQWMNHWNH